MTNLTDDLQGIRSQFVREDYVERVKRRVRQHLSDLEPGAEIEDTHYFNHSAIPDYVLTWPGGARRNVYLRSTYASIVASEDTKNITVGDPVFFSLDQLQEVDEPDFRMSSADVEEAATSSRYTLLTDASASQEIAQTASDDTGSPLSTVVRTNFLKGGRGLVDEPVAAALTDTTAPDAANALIREKFFEDAVVRMERTAAIVSLATVRTVDAGFDDTLEQLLSGTLTTEEVQSILPWVLKHAESDDPRFWRSLGSLFGLEQLESIASEIEGLNVTRLVGASADAWRARRAYVGLHVDADAGAQEDARWQFDNGLLTRLSSGVALRVSTSGNRLQRRPGGQSKRWEDVAGRLEDFAVSSVQLRGIVRDVTLRGRSGNSLHDDVRAATESLEDSYFAEEVELSVIDEEENVTVRVDFPGSLIVAQPALNLSSLVRVADSTLASQTEPNSR